MESVISKGRIHQLESLVANQIAAGEVIERPASVIKELLENSLDAKATRLDIRIEDGGMKRIQVTDNGCGIHVDDLALALLRHATSKIRHSNDLAAITTLGFRGEALSSIAAVARISILSRHQESETAYQLDYHPGTEVLSGPYPVGHAVGTTIIIEELFFTVPARKHFLRSVRTEMNHIEELVKRLALANHQVAVQLFHNKKSLLHYPLTTSAQSLAKRLQQVMGKAFIEQARHIEKTATGLHLQAWLGEANSARSQSDGQFLYVNGRMVRDKLLNHAVRQSYGETIYPGRYPVYVLFLQVEDDAVDVNVHPTKHEVRFRQVSLVHDFISHSLQFAPEPSLLKQAVSEPLSAESSYLKPPLIPAEKSWPTALSAPTAAPMRVQLLIPLGNTWLLAKVAEQLLCIHVHASLASIAKTALSAACLEQKKLPHSALLIPETLTLPEQILNRLDEQATFCQQLGFEFSRLSTQQLVLRQVASVFKHADKTVLLNGLAESLQQSADQMDIIDDIACLAAPPELKQLPESLRQSLFHAAMAADQSICCRHGHHNHYLVNEQNLLDGLKNLP